MVLGLAAGEEAEESVVLITVVEGSLAAMGIFLVVSAPAGAMGAGEHRAAGEVVAEARKVMQAGEVV